MYKIYCKYAGGYFFIFLVLLFLSLHLLIRNGADVLLKNKFDISEFLSLNDVIIYLVLTIGSNFLIIMRTMTCAVSGYRACKIIHNQQIERLIKAPINKFYDITPIGRILNRLTEDQGCID